MCICVYASRCCATLLCVRRTWGESAGLAHLVAHVQSEEQHQHACGGVAAMVPGPAVMDVLKERWVVDLDLEGQREGSNPGQSRPRVRERNLIWTDHGSDTGGGGRNLDQSKL